MRRRLQRRAEAAEPATERVLGVQCVAPAPPMCSPRGACMPSRPHHHHPALLQYLSKSIPFVVAQEMQQALHLNRQEGQGRAGSDGDGRAIASVCTTLLPVIRHRNKKNQFGSATICRGQLMRKQPHPKLGVRSTAASKMAPPSAA